jgi:hypothetical protein
MKKINSIKEHLIDADESYFEHFSFAFTNGIKLLAIAFALIIHSILPCFFPVTASRNIKIMDAKFDHRVEQRNIRKSKKIINKLL